MGKVTIRLAIIVALFFATLTILKQVDWMTILNVEQLTSSTEEKLGELLWNIIDQQEIEISDEEILIIVDSLTSHICSYNNIDRSQIKLHLINRNEINAYALPDNHLVIFSGLILGTENEAELCGVICHEIAHMEKDHVSKKLIKEIGLSVIISTTIGNSSPEIISNALQLLTSSAYDRKLEKEADITAVDYMQNANINPLPFADFLSRTWGDESEIMESLSWVSTHPEAATRSQYIISYCDDITWKSDEILESNTWEKLQYKLRDY